MLPATNFDYKSVDFHSFAGGSAQNSANEAQFQQPKVGTKNAICYRVLVNVDVLRTFYARMYIF